MREKLGQTIARISARAAAIERNDRLGALAGILLLAVLAVADLVLGADVALTGSMIVVPFIVALWAGTGITLLVGLATVATAAASGSWNMNFGESDYDVRLVVLVAGVFLAVATAWARERARLGAHRLELLDEVGAVADGSLPLAQTLERVIEVIVPDFADLCMVDAIHERRVLRSAVRVRGLPGDSDRLAEFRLLEREPSLPPWMTRPDAPFPRQPRFIPRFNDEDVRRLAHGPEDLEWMRSLGLSSAITVAILARDRMLGALTVATAWSGRRYTLDDVRFAQALASRVALALDNAGLFSDLESVERRMDNVMSMLDEAVVIHDAQGELVFANPAAATMLGFEEVRPGASGPAATTAESIGERYVIRGEDGSELAPDELVGRRALTGMTPEPLVLRVSPRDGGPERWLISRAKPILGPDGRALYSVTAIEDVTAVKRAEFAERLLARAGDLLSTSTDYREMLTGLAELAVPDFAEWCTVEVPAADGSIEQLAISHANEEGRGQMIELRRRYPLRVDDAYGVGDVIRTGVPRLIDAPSELITEVAQDPEHERLMNAIGIRSLLLVPMAFAGRTLGVLAFGNGDEARAFDAEDLALATELARRAATAVENARLAEERAEVARVLQEGLKPPALPHMPGWESAAVYQPAGEVNAVGGDFYDAFEIEDGWMVTVGDVVGRGAAAASLTALARHTIRTTGLLTGDPRRALELLDAELRARGEDALCTAAILVLPRSDRNPAKVTFVSGGHPLPLRLRDGAVEEVGTPGPLLGAFEGASWQPEQLALAAGDQLILFTDGVIEARGREDRFGEERLHAELAGADGPLVAIRRITRALEGFIGGEPDDDVAVVAVRRDRVGRFREGPTHRAEPGHSRDAPIRAWTPSDRVPDAR
jgi:serine phosphatase RsbU (regulator of sigma subunit)/PAS domain-containing protein